MQECETISLICEQLKDSKAFKTVKYESGYAEFEKIGNIDDLKFSAPTISFKHYYKNTAISEGGQEQLNLKLIQ